MASDHFQTNPPTPVGRGNSRSLSWSTGRTFTPSGKIRYEEAHLFEGPSGQGYDREHLEGCPACQSGHQLRYKDEPAPVVESKDEWLERHLREFRAFRARTGL